MNKRINFTIAAVLTMGMFVSALTAAPSKVSPDLSNETTVAQLQTIQTSEASTDTAVSTSPSSSAQTSDSVSTTSQLKPQNSTTPRPRPQSQASVSRGSQESAASSSSSSAAAVISTAKRYLGVKYVWGGTSPSGFDCSGFTQYVFAQHGISLPRVSQDQFNQGRTVSLSNLQPGDLIFFSLDQDKVIDHVGIYTGNGQFINASSSKGVTIYPLGSYWESHLIGAKRVL
ncbi:C40 family peptidase [Desulfitobacterium sp.]|uniref:C40 family peptidase n=1 Tax=Desulfitobacterium sp. TaxID=49981 RepID=UPI002CF1F153|nr:C40 family peptidase [Desulfitobacterium sp.]HVJ50037.1 C40 family peptidase [Desulfitobacterium sp.]